jgi:hypothetical protein
MASQYDAGDRRVVVEPPPEDRVVVGTPPPPERSLGELLSELSQETTTLISKEIQLAKTEMTQTATEVGKNVGFLTAGGAVAYAGFLFILAGIALLIGQALAPNVWLGPLLVGLIVAAIGGFLAWKGYNDLKEVNPVPEKTIQSVQETKEHIQERIK